eukprot:jgi/Bigna1/87667/estExt_fgenesh1_pg.C_220220
MGGGMGMAAQIGSQYIQANGAKIMQSSATKILACLDISSLKGYYAVDNYYVLHKLRLILLPFRHNDWNRKADAPGSSLGAGGPVPGSPPSDHALYKTPREDVNAPDLYIPLMAFITYILVFAYALGVDNRFNPEVLSLTASWAMVMLMLEVMMLWGGFWFLNVEAVRRPYLLDLLAYCSYKFVGVTVGMVVGLIAGATAYYVVTIFFGITMCIFLLKSLNYVTTSFDGTVNQKRYFLAFMGILQIFLSVFLSRQSLPTTTSS